MKISVVIPHYNDADNLIALLNALCAQTIGVNEFEVIIVDDASTESLTCVRTILSDLPYSVQLIAAEKCGPGGVRNIGAVNASAELIAFVDSDCLPDGDWLSQVYAAFSDMEIDVIYGYVYTDSGVLFPRYAAPAGHPFVTANIAVRSAAFHQLGGFPEHLPTPYREDTYFGLLLTQLSVRMACVPAARVYHPIRLQRLRKVFLAGLWHAADVNLWKDFGDLSRREIGKLYTRPILASGISPLGAATLVALGLICWELLGLHFAFAGAIALGYSFFVAVSTLCATWRSRANRTAVEISVNAIMGIPYFVGWFLGRVRGSLHARKLCI